MKKFLFGVLIGMLCVAGYMAYKGQQTDGQSDEGTVVLEIEASPDVTADVPKNDDAELPSDIGEVLDYAKQLDEELSPEDAQKLMDTVGKLEELGVSPEVVKEKATELYEKYGKDCVEHVEEAVTEAVKSAAESAAENFANDVKQSVSDTIDGFLNSIN